MAVPYIRTRNDSAKCNNIARCADTVRAICNIVARPLPTFAAQHLGASSERWRLELEHA